VTYHRTLCVPLRQPKGDKDRWEGSLSGRSFPISEANLAALTAQTHEAAAYARNNRYYVNSSGHVVHSASSCEELPPHGGVSGRQHELLRAPSGTCSHHAGVAHWD
jgi:hypothetical protein